MPSSDLGRPRWWVLYLVLPLAAFLLWLIARDGLPDWANEWFAGAVILLVCGLIDAWLVIYRRSLSRDPVHRLGFDVQCEHSTPESEASQRVRGSDGGRGKIVGRFFGGFGEMPALAHGKSTPAPQEDVGRNEE